MIYEYSSNGNKVELVRKKRKRRIEEGRSLAAAFSEGHHRNYFVHEGLEDICY